MIDIINSEKILELLKDDLKNKIRLQVLDKATSTNTLVKEVAKENDEGLVVVAGEQTAGRGRLGRTFFSPGDSGVYMSLLLKPEIEPENAIQITTAAAVSVCKALEDMGINNARIKWVNDIFVDNRKVCGILTESSFNSQKCKIDFAVLGVGINIYESDQGFPEEIKNIAGSVFDVHKENLRNEFIALFINRFYDFYYDLSSKKHIKEYKEKNMVPGKEIDVIQGEQREKAIALDIDENCNLVVKLTDGTIKKLYSGEISVRMC